MTWRPISTVEDAQDDLILLAHFPDDNPTPLYVISAQHGTAMPGWIQLASYSGFFVDGIPLKDPERYRGVHITSGILPGENDELAPTHWMRIPLK